MTSELRIAVCAENISSDAGGAELAVSRYIEGLIEAGQRLTVCTTRNTCQGKVDQLSSLGVKVIRFPFTAIETRPTGRFEHEFRRIFASNDVIYIAKGWYSVARIAKSLGKPVVAHSHDYALFCPHMDLAFEGSSIVPSRIPCSPATLLQCNMGKGRAYAIEGLINPLRAVPFVFLSPLKTLRDYWPRREILKSTSYIDHYVFVSEYSRQLITSHIPNVNGRCSVIYNPVLDPGYIRSSDSSTLRLGYFGGASYIKGYRLLLRALKSLRDSRLHAPIELIAAGTKDTAFSKLVKRLKLDSIVYELPRQSRDELPKLYKCIDVVVVPSLSPEPLPYVAIEAQLFGRPVIASSMGGLPEIVEHKKTGWLFRPVDRGGLATLLSRLMLVPKAELRNIGLAGRMQSLSRFVDTEPIRKLISILETCGNVT